MKHQAPPANKITPPRVGRVYPRERLFGLMDEALGQRAVWISGPGGSGKSTLAASYLEARAIPSLWYLVDEGDHDVATLFHYLGVAARKAVAGRKTSLPHLSPDHLPSLAVFSRRYFEKFFGGLRPPFAVVFDDYQEVADTSLFHEVMQSCLLEVPAGIHVIIISRKSPPAPFTRLRVNNLMEAIGYEELRVTPEETAGIAGLFGREALTGEHLHFLQNKVQGWIAGLVLMLKRGWQTHVAPDVPEGETSPLLFDYFAAEVFDRTAPSIREFLLKTAILPSVTAHMAKLLTGDGDAPHILAELNRNNFFTERRSDRGEVYRYHPLFRRRSPRRSWPHPPCFSTGTGFRSRR